MHFWNCTRVAASPGKEPWRLQEAPKTRGSMINCGCIQLAHQMPIDNRRICGEERNRAVDLSSLDGSCIVKPISRAVQASSNHTFGLVLAYLVELLLGSMMRPWLCMCLRGIFFLWSQVV
jgi:hypothetical protein